MAAGGHFGFRQRDNISEKNVSTKVVPMDLKNSNQVSLALPLKKYTYIGL